MIKKIAQVISASNAMLSLIEFIEEIKPGIFYKFLCDLFKVKCSFNHARIFSPYKAGSFTNHTLIVGILCRM